MGLIPGVVRPGIASGATSTSTPSANSAAMSAQQQPTHHAPFFAPIWNAPSRPARQEPSKKPSGLRHLPRQTSLSGVNSYTAATISVAPATHRPARSHDRTSPATAPPAAARANATAPAAAHVTRYPDANANGETSERRPVIREYRATVGATDGNIMAAIMTTHTVRNQPAVPSPVQGPLSIPRIWFAVHHQPTPAMTNSSATSPSRARAAANAGPRPAPETRSGAETIMPSGCPGELGGREPGPSLVLDAEAVDPRALCLRHRQVGRDRVEHAGESHRLTGLNAERHHVLDLEVDLVADAHAVADAVVDHLDGSTLNTEHLAHERGQLRHRAAQLAAEDLDQLVQLIVGRSLIDEHAEPPVPLGHDLRRVSDGSNLETTDVGALDLSLADVEDERHATEVVGGAVVE